VESSDGEWTGLMKIERGEGYGREIVPLEYQKKTI
jgi:hypothetical protein